MNEFLTILGTLASLVGMAISIYQAKKAKSAADEATLIKTQLIKHRETSELSQVQALCRKAQNAMAKYGPGSGLNSLKGIKHQNDSQEVQEFMFFIKEHREYFDDENKNKADLIYDSILNPLAEFSTAKDTHKIKELGNDILLKINEFTPIIKKMVDYK